MNMEFRRKLPIPKDIKAMFPISEEYAAKREARDKEIKDIISGRSDRFLLVIGPCSADNEDAVLEYLTRLRRVQDKVEEKICIVPRVYTNKPRTTGMGYKGMLHQPDHRLTASGLDIPVGMKNPTSGDLSVMMNSIVAAQSSHTFIYRNWEVVSQGNPYAHAILRGHTNKRGQSIPNYHYEDLILTSEMYLKKELKNPAIIVDANHANSGKQYLEQIRITREILQSMRLSPEIGRMVKGIMIESYLEDGCQPVNGTVFGQSVTDPCLGWEKTEKLINEIAESI